MWLMATVVGAQLYNTATLNSWTAVNITDAILCPYTFFCSPTAPTRAVLGSNPFSIKCSAVSRHHVIIIKARWSPNPQTMMKTLANIRPVPKRCHGTHVCVLSCSSHVWLFATLWTVARQAPLSIEFSRQEYWSGLPCPPPRDRPKPAIKPTSYIPFNGRQVLYH